MIKKMLVVKKITNPYTIDFVIGSLAAKVFPCHFHATYCLGIVENGERIIDYKDASYTASAGDIFIINQYKTHSCKINSLQHSYKIICFGPELMQSIYKDLSSNNYKIITGFKEEIIRNKNIFYKIRRLINIVFTKYSILESNNKIKNAIEYINEHYYENISLNTLSKLSCLSPFHFIRIFSKSIYRFSCKRWIIRFSYNNF